MRTNKVALQIAIEALDEHAEKIATQTQEIQDELSLHPPKTFDEFMHLKYTFMHRIVNNLPNTGGACPYCRKYTPEKDPLDAPTSCTLCEYGTKYGICIRSTKSHKTLYRRIQNAQVNLQRILSEAKEQEYPEPCDCLDKIQQKKELHLTIGKRYIIEGTEFILACPAATPGLYDVVLINVKTGNRWEVPITVDIPHIGAPIRLSMLKPWFTKCLDGPSIITPVEE